MTADTIKKYIRSEFFPQGKFTADDVYMSDLDPPDLPMYDALAAMVEAGELQYVGEEYATRHTEMIYEVPT